MALTEGEKAKVGAFLGALMRGAADLGFSALPLVALYTKARVEKTPLTDFILKDPAALDAVIQSLKRQAKTLPLPVIIALEGILTDARKSKP